MSDIDTLRQIEGKVGRPFHHVLEGDRCVSLDLVAEDFLFHGLIRRHSESAKEEIMTLVCKLTALRHLNLRRNKLGRLPGSFAALDQLESLTLGSNYLGEVPRQIRGFRKLKFLHLGNNDLTELPAFVGDFKDLEYLALHKNLKLKAIDPVAGLEQLKALNLYFLSLGGLPAFVYDLQNLVTLTLFNTANLTDDVSRLTNLEYFTDCAAPSLRALPDGITKLRKLRMIRLFQNNLECLPERFGDLENLEQLSLYQNKLSSLPDSFSRLEKLQKLNLAWNRFETLHPSLGDLPVLEWVGLFENPLRNRAEVMFQSRTRVDWCWPFTTLPQVSRQSSKQQRQ